jgi:transcriptional regulator with XRE-family HTH domain
MTPAELKQARQSAGLTQSAAAALLGVALRTWQSWEDGGRNGRRMPAFAWRCFVVLSREKGAKPAYTNLVPEIIENENHRTVSD